MTKLGKTPSSSPAASPKQKNVKGLPTAHSRSVPDSYRPLCAAAAGAAARREMARSKHRSRAGAMPAPSKKPAGARRFRRGDEQVRAVSSFADLDEYTCFLDYLLVRIDEQCKEIRRKLGLYENLEPHRRAAALRELHDNVKELQPLNGRVRQCAVCQGPLSRAS